MKTIPLGWDGDVATRFHYDHSEDKAYLSYHQDAAPVLERNHAFRVDGQKADPVLGKKVAEIPAVVYMEWCRLAGVPVSQFMRWKRQEKVAFLKRFLNDHDWYKIKTVEGRV